MNRTALAPLQRPVETLGKRRRGDVRLVHTALDGWPKSDVMLHDFLTELEPYCPEFAGILLRKFHLTPEPPPGYGWDDGPHPEAASLPGGR